MELNNQLNQVKEQARSELNISTEDSEEKKQLPSHDALKNFGNCIEHMAANANHNNNIIHDLTKLISNNTRGTMESADSSNEFPRLGPESASQPRPSEPRLAGARPYGDVGASALEPRTYAHQDLLSPSGLMPHLYLPARAPPPHCDNPPAPFNVPGANNLPNHPYPGVGMNQVPRPPMPPPQNAQNYLFYMGVQYHKQQ